MDSVGEGWRVTQKAVRTISKAMHCPRPGVYPHLQALGDKAQAMRSAGSCEWGVHPVRGDAYRCNVVLLALVSADGFLHRVGDHRRPHRPHRLRLPAGLEILSQKGLGPSLCRLSSFAGSTTGLASTRFLLARRSSQRLWAPHLFRPVCAGILIVNPALSTPAMSWTMWATSPFSGGWLCIDFYGYLSKGMLSTHCLSVHRSLGFGATMLITLGQMRPCWIKATYYPSYAPA